jgi:thymidylate kinase
MTYAPLNLSIRLLEALNSSAVDYCCWKETGDVAKALAGDEDLDLLVDRDHFPAFLGIILSLGFREAYNRNIKFPSVFHYFGADLSSGKFLHIHVFLKVMTGESHTKDYHLPIERRLLRGNTLDPNGCRIPQPEVELIVFLIRHYIKISCLPGAVLLRTEGTYGSEFSGIYSRIDLGTLLDVLLNDFSFISLELFEEMLAGILERRPMYRKFITGQKLRWSLSHFRRRGLAAGFVARYYQILYRLANKLVIRRKKSLSAGGEIIAITGLDASGKSTVSRELARWLGSELTVRLIHAGRPKPRLETLPFRVAVEIARSIRYGFATRASGLHLKIQPGQGIFSALHYVVLAYERYFLLRKAHRLRAAGCMVISDRYPSMDEGKMDSPKIRQSAGNRSWINFLGMVERRLYNAMPEADEIFNLTVPFDVAVARNRARVKRDKESDLELRDRHASNANLHYSARKYQAIDASRELPVVLEEIRQRIWEPSPKQDTVPQSSQETRMGVAS